VRNSNDAEQLLKTEGNYALDRIEFLIRNGVTEPLCEGGVLVTLTKVQGEPQYQRNILWESHAYELELGAANRRLVLETRTNVNGMNKEENRGDAVYLTSEEVYLGRRKVIVNNGTEVEAGENLQFACEPMVPSGPPNQTAKVTVSFTLWAQEAKDYLNASSMYERQDFERTITVQNNYPFLWLLYRSNEELANSNATELDARP
jgi:hypothetical protein